MERDNRLKRARDIERDEDREYHKEKKREITVDEDESYKGDATGVFDFPWLKEGGFVAVVDELLEPHDAFTRCLAESDFQANSNVDQYCCVQRDSSLVDLPDCKFEFDDLDCLLRCLIDQPPDVNVCINKP